MKKIFKLLLGLSIVSLLAISCDDDDEVTPAKKNTLTIDKTEYTLSAGAFTNNDADKSRSAFAFATDGLKLSENASDFNLSGAGQLLVLYMEKSGELKEGTYDISKDKTGITVNLKISNTNRPEVNEFVILSSGKLIVKKTETGYSVSLEDGEGARMLLPKDKDLSELTPQEIISSIVSKDLTISKINIKANYSGEIMMFNNVDWNDYIDMEKFNKIKELIPNIDFDFNIKDLFK